MMNTHPVGVLSDSEVLLLGVVRGRRALRSLFVPPDLSEPHALCAFLWEEELRSVWVMPDTSLSRNASEDWLAQVRQHWAVVTHVGPEPARPACIFLWPKQSNARPGEPRQARRLALVFPQHAGWKWKLSDPRSLLASVTYLEQVLARPLTDAPDLLAQQLLSELLPHNPSSPSFPASQGPAHTWSGNEQVLSWARPLTLAELRQRYLHKYTHLSWYLQGCLTLRLGMGNAEYSSNGRAYDALRPGLWRIQVDRAGSVFDNKRLPACPQSAWVSTPQVKCCQDAGYRVEVSEGYCWPQAQELLKPWADMLWQAAERLCLHPRSYQHTQGRANCYQALADLVQRGLATIARDREHTGWERPDWWAAVVGRARAVLFAHLAGMARKGAMPVLLHQNALWVVADDPNPFTAVPGLLSLQKWRGYIPGYRVPLTLSRDVQTALRTSEQPARIAAALDALAEEPAQGVGEP
ncbi:MAG TPA: hypothetical protein VGF67_04875 [Ktedonobacteraceae bacterium]